MDIFLPANADAEALTVKYDVEAADLTSMLLSTYILTGCDTVCYMYRRGKCALTKLPLLTWQTLCCCADTVTLKRAWRFRKML